MRHCPERSEGACPEQSEGKILEVERLSFSYGQGFALKGVSFNMAEGEILGIIGPNSSGKTTLLRLLSKVLIPYEGSIRLLGRELSALSRREVARVVAVVPQDSYLAFPFTVREVILMGRHPHSQGFFFEGEEDLRVAEEAMKATGVLHLAQKPLDVLSGGERRLAVIARALAQCPRILLLDEPLVHLDLHHQVEIMKLLKQLNEEQGTTMLFVSHDLNVAAEACHRLLLLSTGKVHRVGRPEEVIDERTIEEVYGCRVRVEAGPGGRLSIYPMLTVDG